MDRAGFGGAGLQVLYDVTTTLSRVSTLEEAASGVLATIGSGLGWSVATLWKLDVPSQTMMAIASWSAPEILALPWPDSEEPDDRPFGRGEARIGRVWQTGEPCWLEGGARETDTVGSRIAARTGLRGMLLTPIGPRQNVVGVLELFCREEAPPDRELSRTLEILGMHLGQHIERNSAEKALVRSEIRFSEELDRRLVERTAELESELAISSRLQAKLRDGQAKLRRLYESDIIGILVADTEGRVKEANDAWLRMLGYTREDVDAGLLRWDRMTPPEWAARDQQLRLEVLEFGATQNNEKELFHKDGSRVPVVMGAALLEGSHTDCICFVLDNTARKKAEEALARLNEELERRVEERMESLVASEARLAHTAQALARSEQRLRLLAAHVETVREAERARLAREIHDVLGQELTGLKMDVAWVVRRLMEATQPGGEKIIGRLQSMLLQIDSTIGIVRRIATELRPAALDLGLTAAMDWLAREFEARSGVVVEFVATPEDLVVDGGRATALFRIFQELLTNVARHSGACRVRATLGLEGDSVLLEVRDDGRGIAEAEASSHSSLGLLGVHERALVFGGECSFTGTPGKGTHVTVRIPLGASEQVQASDQP